MQEGQEIRFSRTWIGVTAGLLLLLLTLFGYFWLSSSATELVYRVSLETAPPGKQGEAVAATIEVLRERLCYRGFLAPFRNRVRVENQDKGRILVRVAGKAPEEVARVKRLVECSGRLEFRLVNDDLDAKSDALEGRPVRNCTPFVKPFVEGGADENKWFEPTTFSALKEHNCPGLLLLVCNTPEMTGNYLERVFRTVDHNNLPAVGFEFDSAGRKKFALVTDRNIGKQLAIVVNDRVCSAPVIKSRIAGGGIIEGEFTVQEVEDLVATLRSGSLPAPLVLESERTVGL